MSYCWHDFPSSSLLQIAPESNTRSVSDGKEKWKKSARSELEIEIGKNIHIAQNSCLHTRQVTVESGHWRTFNTFPNSSPWPRLFLTSSSSHRSKLTSRISRTAACLLNLKKGEELIEVVERDKKEKIKSTHRDAALWNH